MNDFDHTLESRSIAEHLCMLAGLLDAELMRAGALGARPDRTLVRKAKEVRQMADRLWQADTVVTLPPQKEIRAANEDGSAPDPIAAGGKLVALHR